MDDQLRDGVLFVQRQQGVPLRRVVLADTGLDGHPQIRQALKYLAEAAVQLLRVGQQPRALVLGRYRSGGAAQVEVHLPVSPFVQFPGGPEEVIAPVGQQLGHGVRFALYLIQLLLLEAQIGVGRQERGEVFVRAAEQLPVDLPPPAGGQALHRRGVQFYVNHSAIPPVSHSTPARRRIPPAQGIPPLFAPVRPAGPAFSPGAAS